MNIGKIIANAGIAFCTTLSATALTGGAEVNAALLSAVILAGLAFFTELKLECDGEHSAATRIQEIISKSLVV